MDIHQVKTLCRELPLVNVIEKGPPSNILTYLIDKKQFAYFKTSTPEQWRFSIRVTPERFLELTDQPGIKPARYMHRFYWVSIVNVKSMDSDYLKTLIHWSYQKAVSNLSKKRQNEIKQCGSLSSSFANIE